MTDLDRAAEEYAPSRADLRRGAEREAFQAGAKWAIAHDPVVVQMREALEFYASVNTPKDPGSWAMRKRFIFDLIQPDDCDNAHYENKRYCFGGKRAREALARIRKGQADE